MTIEGYENYMLTEKEDISTRLTNNPIYNINSGNNDIEYALKLKLYGNNLYLEREINNATK